jgi:hypothetical protein
MIAGLASAYWGITPTARRAPQSDTYAAFSRSASVILKNPGLRKSPSYPPMRPGVEGIDLRLLPDDVPAKQMRLLMSSGQNCYRPRRKALPQITQANRQLMALRQRLRRTFAG